MTDEISELQQENARLKEQITIFESQLENTKLEAQNKVLKSENKILKLENRVLRSKQKNLKLISEIATLKESLHENIPLENMTDEELLAIILKRKIAPENIE